MSEYLKISYKITSCLCVRHGRTVVHNVLTRRADVIKLFDSGSDSDLGMCGLAPSTEMKYHVELFCIVVCLCMFANPA